MEALSYISAPRTGLHPYRSCKKQACGISTPMRASGKFCIGELAETKYQLFAFARNSSPRKMNITMRGTANMLKKWSVMKDGITAFIGKWPPAHPRVPSGHWSHPQSLRVTQARARVL